MSLRPNPFAIEDDKPMHRSHRRPTRTLEARVIWWVGQARSKVFGQSTINMRATFAPVAVAEVGTDVGIELHG